MRTASEKDTKSGFVHEQRDPFQVVGLKYISGAHSHSPQLFQREDAFYATLKSLVTNLHRAKTPQVSELHPGSDWYPKVPTLLGANSHRSMTVQSDRET